MSSLSRNQYIPDYVSPPGETLLEAIGERGMSQSDLARRMGRPKKTINEIVRGKAAITPETALQIERVLGISADFWNNREQHYRQHLARKEERARLARQAVWLEEFPVQAMITMEWIQAFDDPVQQLGEVLQFFGVVSPSQWDDVWSRYAVAFRKALAFDSDHKALAAWLRRGEVEAQHIHCRPYSTDAFRQTLQDIRHLTLEPADVFQPKLVGLCAMAGVAVVFVPQLHEARVSGATRWLHPQKALIQLSLRYKTDDHLWFTFFHEAAHILFHGKRTVFLEDDQGNGPKEQEANSFAANTLIPPPALIRFLKRSRPGRLSKGEIRAFATELGIAAGIVVGRLQHDDHLPYSHCNDLKRRFAWAD